MSYILGQSLDGFILMAYSEECSIISIEKQDFVILLTIFAHILACARMCRMREYLWEDDKSLSYLWKSSAGLRQ